MKTKTIQPRANKASRETELEAEIRDLRQEMDELRAAADAAETVESLRVERDRLLQERDDLTRDAVHRAVEVDRLRAALAESERQREAWEAAAMIPPDDAGLKAMTAERDAALAKVEELAKAVGCLELSGRQLAQDREHLQRALHLQVVASPKQPPAQQPQPARQSRRERLGM